MVSPWAFLGPGELWALGSSLAFALTLTLLRRGLTSATPMAAFAVIQGTVCAGALLIALGRGTLWQASPGPLMWFALSGLVGQGIGSITFFLGIERIGISRATPIHSSSPIWAVFFAMAALGERPGPEVVAGTVLIVAGVALLSWPAGKEGGGWRAWLGPGFGYAFISSICYAIMPVFAKLGFAGLRAPFVASGTAFAAGLAVLAAGKRLLPARGAIAADARGLRLLFLAGGFNLLASAFLWTALSVGWVSTVLPISRITPLWVVFLSYAFLGELERVTARVVMAALLVVGGGVLVTVFG